MCARRKSTFTFVFLRETALAILVGSDGDEFWLPKSQIQWVGSAEEDDEIEVTLPEWLAEEKGLL